MAAAWDDCRAGGKSPLVPRFMLILISHVLELGIDRKCGLKIFAEYLEFFHRITGYPVSGQKKGPSPSLDEIKITYKEGINL